MAGTGEAEGLPSSSSEIKNGGATPLLLHTSSLRGAYLLKQARGELYFTLRAGGELSVSVLATLKAGKKHLLPTGERLVGPQIRSRNSGKDRNPFFYLQYNCVL
jgi:hypothetical protein